jgi:hypothetical protein
MAELDRQLARIAVHQRSLVTLRDVEDVGGNRQRVQGRIEAGHLERLERGVYGISGVAPSPDRTLLATMLAARGPVAISHLAAGRRYEIPGYRSAPAELTVERGVRLRRAGLRIHESTDLDRCRIIDVDGLPTTDPARTLLDLGRYVGLQRLRRNIEHCRRVGLVDWDDLIGTLVRHARRGRPGIRKLREAIASDIDRATITDSDLELLVLALLREHGLPEPVLHHEVWDGDRFVAEVDLAYPERRIAMECEGDVHLDPDVRERDLARQNDLVLVGWTVLRFTPARYWQRPAGIVEEVRTAHRTTPPIATCDTPSRHR